MTSRSEQLSVQFTFPFSALGQSQRAQWEAQFDLLQNWGARALDSAEQLIALNLRASRTSVEQATGTFKQLLDATNPRDVIAAGSRAQGQWHYLFEYGRELLGIASSAPANVWSTQNTSRVLPAPLHLAHTANVPTSVSQVLEQASIATADVTTVTTEIAAAAADTGAALAEAGLHATTQAVQGASQAAQQMQRTAADAVDQGTAAAVDAAAQATNTWTDAQADAAQQADALQQQVEAAIETAIADDVPPAKATPLAQALNEVAPKPASAEHPIASTIALEAADHVELPHVTPVDAEPPVHVPVPPPAAAKEQRRTRTRK